MAAPPPNERRGVDRLEAFSDGVFAIAITLLVLGVEVPDVDAGQLGGAIADLWPDIGAYFLGFAVIGLFWVGHHAFFGQVERHDPALLWSNLLFLSLIALMPFTSALIGEYGGEPVGTIFFAVNVGAAALVNGLCEIWSFRNGLMETDPGFERRAFRRATLTPLIFFGSVPVALLSAGLAQLTWLALPVVLRVWGDPSRKGGRARASG